MNKIIDYIQKENINENSIFSEHEILDWYDGPILGIGTLFGSNELYFFEMVAFNLKKDERIFLLLNIDMEWKSKLDEALFSVTSNVKPSIIKKNVTQLFSNYSNKVYLLKAKDIDDNLFKLKEVSIGNLKHYDNLEVVLNQGEKLTKRWFDFFN